MALYKSIYLLTYL